MGLGAGYGRGLAGMGMGALLVACALGQGSAVVEPPAAAAAGAHFVVRLAPSAAAPVTGRVLVFAKLGAGDKEVNSEEFRPADVWVGAIDVQDLQPGATVVVDGAGKAAAYPRAFAAMPAGQYEAQAVLDPDGSYNYSGRGPQDLISAVVPVAPAGGDTTLTLDGHAPEDPRATEARARLASAAKPGEIELQRMESPALTRFSGRPTFVQGYVVLPPGYAEHPADRYPTAYWTAGFGGDLESSLGTGLLLRKRMLDGTMPPMIWVMLDESCAHGTHEFADSVNNGPWGTALTREYIPMLETRYRMDAKPTGRLLNGHSSGGWATLQLQVNYPDVFGGTWSTSPDPSDFHNFTGPDLYASNANVYNKPGGGAWPIMRMDGKVVATLEQFARMESVLGPYGGQISSFDWVFSPRDVSGAPEPMFDHVTGAVNPSVVAYWGEHYDLANIVERTWPERGPMLRGRIHLFVGTADTFYLDGAAHLFEARLQRLGADPHFSYVPGASHFTVYQVGQDRNGLFDRIGTEMYAVARPGVNWKR